MHHTNTLSWRTVMSPSIVLARYTYLHMNIVLYHTEPDCAVINNIQSIDDEIEQNITKTNITAIYQKS